MDVVIISSKPLPNPLKLEGLDKDALMLAIVVSGSRSEGCILTVLFKQFLANTISTDKQILFLSLRLTGCAGKRCLLRLILGRRELLMGT